MSSIPILTSKARRAAEAGNSRMYFQVRHRLLHTLSFEQVRSCHPYYVGSESIGHKYPKFYP